MSINPLTDVDFWEKYWGRVSLPCTVDMNFSFERCLAAHLRRHLSRCRGGILEIGCAPGKWLAFAAMEIGLKPGGIEYTHPGYEATLRNLKMLGVDCGEIREGDFLTMVPDRTFDVVMSLGFIEHFNDADEVVGRHLEWLGHGGVLILGVPNFRGIYRWIQGVLDKTILERHNLEIMRLEYFLRLEEKFGLTLDSIEYIGSFEPHLPIRGEGRNTLAQTLVKALLHLAILVRRRFRFLDRLNHPWVSSYILAVYRNPARTPA